MFKYMILMCNILYTVNTILYVHLFPFVYSLVPAVTLASNKMFKLSGEVTDGSEAAGLTYNQLGTRMSAGREWLWSRVRLLPASTLTLKCKWALHATGLRKGVSKSMVIITILTPCPAVLVSDAGIHTTELSKPRPVDIVSYSATLKYHPRVFACSLIDGECAMSQLFLIHISHFLSSISSQLPLYPPDMWMMETKLNVALSKHYNRKDCMAPVVYEPEYACMFI